VNAVDGGVLIVNVSWLILPHVSGLTTIFAMNRLQE